MSDYTAEHRSLTARAAYKKWKTTIERMAKFSLFNDQFSLLIDPLINTLDTFPLNESDDTSTKALIPDRDSVRVHLHDALVEPDEYFARDKIGRVMLCIRAVYDLATIYDVTDIDPEYSETLALTNFEKGHSAICAVMTCSYLMNMTPEDCRTVINRYKNVKLSISDGIDIKTVLSAEMQTHQLQESRGLLPHNLIYQVIMHPVSLRRTVRTKFHLLKMKVLLRRFP